MQTRPLGPTGWTVSAVGLGGMPLSIRGRPSESDAVRVIHASLDAGVTLIDTADVYCLDDGDIGHNERLIARALREAGRTDVIVATKGGLERPRGRWTCNGRPEHIRRACEKSLNALDVDAIALYQLHAPDDDVPFDESVGAMARLKEEGKVQHVGLSNVSASEIEAARRIVPVVSVQNRCNPFDRRAWTDGVIPLCEREGLAFLPYAPVGGQSERRKLANDRVLKAVGARYRASSEEVALAWLLATSPAMIPIPGASRVESAQSSARASELTLSPDDLAELRAAFPVA